MVTDSQNEVVKQKFISDQKLRLLLKDCANGFYQQMYYWGKDVLHPKGNLLREYGFVKTPSKGLRGTSCYSLEFDEGVIELYGSCAAYYSDECNMVFLRKRCRFYEWLPEHRLVAGRWSQDDIQVGDPDAMLKVLKPFFNWWLAYEKWIEQRIGGDYRQQCFIDWGKVKGKPAWLPPESAMSWVEDFLKLGSSHVRPKHYEKQEE